MWSKHMASLGKLVSKGDNGTKLEQETEHAVRVERQQALPFLGELEVN